MTSKSYETFEELNTRLKEIVEAVGDESLPLDDALSLYEEAVTLGLRASDLLEENIQAREVQELEAEEGSSEADRETEARVASESQDAEGHSGNEAARESSEAQGSFESEPESHLERDASKDPASQSVVGGAR